MTTRPKPAMASCLYLGQVMHKRLRPFRHRFRYPVLYGLFDLDELPRLDRTVRAFGHNRRGLFSLWDRDHGPRDGRPLRPWIESHLRAMDIDLEGGSIRLLCIPRLLGYAFNPLSIWFCHHRDGGLRAVLYEVHNTFGQAHSYLIPVLTPESDPADPRVVPRAVTQACPKSFYVSPFLDMAQRYHFRLCPPDERLSLRIRQDNADGTVLVAGLTGERRPLSDRSLLAAAASRPGATLKVTLAIHWQALRLWYKGARTVPRPAPPAAEVSYVPQAVPGAVLRTVQGGNGRVMFLA